MSPAVAPAGVAAALAASSMGARVTLAEASGRISPDRSLLPGLLSGSTPPDELYDTTLDYLTGLGVDARLEEPVLSVEAGGRFVRSRNGRIDFDSLVLATGSVPNPVDLRGVSKPGVFIMRSAGDYLALSAALRRCARVVLAGPLPFSLVLAQEIARTSAVSVFLGDIAPSRFARRTIGAIAEAASSRGVRLLQHPIEAIVGVGRAEAVVSRRSVHPCDAAVVLPSYRPFLPEVDCSRGDQGGAIVDEAMRTSFRSVYAAGECAEARCGSGSLPTRLRSSSLVMGGVAGTNASGGIARVSVSRCMAVELFGVELCAAGIDAEGARRLGLDAEEFETDQDEGGLFVSLAYDRASLRLCGLQIVGRGATLLSEFVSLAVSTGRTLEDLARNESPHIPRSRRGSSPIALTASRALARARGYTIGESQGTDLRHG